MRFCLPLLLMTTLAFAQDEEIPLFKTGVSLVKVDAQVQDRTGKDINGLRAGDLIVYDEGEPQPVTDFGAEGEPIRVLLLLDVSGSMSRHLAALGVKSTALLSSLRPGDLVGLMNFATRSELVQELTPDTKLIGAKITGSIYRQTLGRDTFVNEAILEAAKYMASQPVKGRRAILVVTDNEGGLKSVTNALVVKSVHAANALLSAVIVGADAGPSKAARYRDPLSGPPDLFRFAADTGGHVVTSEAPVDVLGPVLKDVTTRYSLTYTAPPGSEDGSFRRIRVELSPAAKAKFPGAKITARSGYTVGQSNPGEK